MSDDQKTNVIFLAGQMIGMALRFPPEVWLEAAESPELRPEYREAILLLAQFRECLGERP